MKSTAQRLLVILTLVAFAGLMQMAFAQGRGQGMRMSPQQRADTLGKQLSLDTTQIAKVAGIFEKYQKIMTDKRTELQGDMDAMRTAMTKIREKQNKEITALLTKEQAKKYEEIQKEQMQRMQNRQPRNN